MATHGMTSDHGPVDRLAEEFLERHRRGERPAIAEYIERHPEWADEIREVFPALVMMEQLKPTPDDLTGSDSGASAAPAAAVRAAGRLPHPPRGRPRGHGGRLRGESRSRSAATWR